MQVTAVTPNSSIVGMALSCNTVPLIPFPIKNESSPSPLQLRQWEFFDANESVTFIGDAILKHLDLLKPLTELQEQNTSWDLDLVNIKPSTVQIMFNFLENPEKSLTAENLHQILIAAEYFDTQKLFNEIQNHSERIQNALKNIHQSDKIHIFDILATFCSPEFCLELIPKCSKNLKETKILCDRVPRYNNIVHRLFLDMYASIAEGKSLSQTPEYKIFKKELKGLDTADFIDILDYLPKAKPFTEPIFKAMIKEIISRKDENSFWEDLKNKLAGNDFRRELLDDLIQYFKRLNKDVATVNKCWDDSSLNELSSFIDKKIIDLDCKIKGLEDLAKGNTKDKDNLDKIRLLHNVAKKCLENLQQGIKIKDKSHFITVMWTIIAVLMILSAFASLAVLLYFLITLPRHQEMIDGAMRWVTDMDKNSIIGISVFSGGIVAFPVYIAIVGALFHYQPQFKKKKHLLRGIHRFITPDLESPTSENIS